MNFTTTINLIKMELKNIAVNFVNIKRLLMIKTQTVSKDMQPTFTYL